MVAVIHWRAKGNLRAHGVRAAAIAEGETGARLGEAVFAEVGHHFRSAIHSLKLTEIFHQLKHQFLIRRQRRGRSEAPNAIGVLRKGKGLVSHHLDAGEVAGRKPAGKVAVTKRPVLGAQRF